MMIFFFITSCTFNEEVCSFDFKLDNTEGIGLVLGAPLLKMSNIKLFKNGDVIIEGIFFPFVVISQQKQFFYTQNRKWQWYVDEEGAIIITKKNTSIWNGNEFIPIKVNLVELIKDYKGK